MKRINFLPIAAAILFAFGSAFAPNQHKLLDPLEQGWHETLTTPSFHDDDEEALEPTNYMEQATTLDQGEIEGICPGPQTEFVCAALFNGIDEEPIDFVYVEEN